MSDPLFRYAIIPFSMHEFNEDETYYFFYREEADNMCKMLAASNYAVKDDEDLSK